MADVTIGGIAATASALAGADLIEIEQGGVSKQAALSLLIGLLLDDDTTLAGDSADVAATQHAVKTAIADAIAGAGGVTSVNGAAGTPIIRQAIAIACSDETTALTAGTNKVKFINPYATAFNVLAVVASLSTAQASGSILTVDINEAGTSILSTKLTIDNTETNSSTAATAAVISDASIAAFAEISVDIDQIGNGTAKGLKVYLIGYPTI